MLGTSMNDANSYAPTAGEVWVFTQPEYKAVIATLRPNNHVGRSQCISKILDKCL